MSVALIIVIMLAISLASRTSGRYRGYALVSMLLVILVSGSYKLLSSDQHVFLNLVGGLLGGQLMFFLSLLITTQSFAAAFQLIKLPIYALAEILKPFSLRYAGISVLEELVWRGSVQRSLGSNLFSIGLVALVFSLAHTPKTNHHRPVLVDLFIFSTLLGIIFAVTDSIYLVIAIHTIRNINLTVMKKSLFLPKVQSEVV